MQSKKKNILVRLIVDTREKNISFLEKFKFDTKYSSEKIKIQDYVIKTFKCLDKNTNSSVKYSVGDVGIEYSLDDGETWNKTNLSIELKRGSDFSTTIYSNYKRFNKEIERAKEYGLDFYLVYNQTTATMKNEFDKLKYLKKIPMYMQPHKIVYDRMIELLDNGVKMIYTHEIEEVIKRIIKNHIKKYKLQY